MLPTSSTKNLFISPHLLNTEMTYTKIRTKKKTPQYSQIFEVVLVTETQHLAAKVKSQVQENTAGGTKFLTSCNFLR